MGWEWVGSPGAAQRQKPPSEPLTRREFFLRLILVDVAESPCQACGDVPCSRACATGALAAIESWKIQLGRVAVDPARCLREGDTLCENCLAACPLPGSALILYPQRAPEIASLVCLGCARCIPACPPQALAWLPPAKAFAAAGVPDGLEDPPSVRTRTSPLENPQMQNKLGKRP